MLSQKQKQYLVICFGCALGIFSGFFVHAQMANTINPIMANIFRTITVAQPPYSSGITAIAALTTLFPGVLLFVAFYFLYQKIPGQTFWVKGIIFALFEIEIKGDLIRMPLMNYAIGIPLRYVVIQQLDVWIPNLIMCLLFSFVIRYLFAMKAPL